MFLKYVVTSGSAAQIQNEIGDLLFGVITDTANCVYGTATLAGTGPTAGTYTRTSISTDTHLRFTKKHCQFDAGVFEPEIELQVFTDPGNGTTLVVRDKNSGNAQHTTSFGQLSGAGSGPTTVGSVHYFIMNDTTFVYSHQEGNQPIQTTEIAITVFSDFEKNDYDTYAIGENPLYYPGGYFSSFCEGAELVYNTIANKNAMNVGRIQFQNSATGQFGNSVLSASYSSNYHYWNYNGNPPGAYHTIFPRPSLRIYKSWGTNGHSVQMIPVIYDGNMAGADSVDYDALSTQVGYRDARGYSPFLNTYAITTATGVTGDYIETSDSTRYYIFGGHRLGNGTGVSTMGTNHFHLSNYAFPMDNVTIS
jgi:hypothetical protein